MLELREGAGSIELRLGFRQIEVGTGQFNQKGIDIKKATKATLKPLTTNICFEAGYSAHVFTG